MARRFDPSALGRIAERLLAHLNPDGGARVKEVLGSLNQCRAPVDGVPDERSPARRDADALVEAMTSLLDEGGLPTRGGQRPHLVITVTLNDLIYGLGHLSLDSGGSLCAAEARRLACDAGVIPMVLDGDSMPLDVGREQRLVTFSLRVAFGSAGSWVCFPEVRSRTTVLPRPSSCALVRRR